MQYFQKKHILEDKISTIFGAILLLFALIYIGKLMLFDTDSLNWTTIGFMLGIAAIGVAFVYGKISTILKFIPGYRQESTKKLNRKDSEV